MRYIFDFQQSERWLSNHGMFFVPASERQGELRWPTSDVQLKMAEVSI